MQHIQAAIQIAHLETQVAVSGFNACQMKVTTSSP
jgi:hypothetical protein